MDLNNPAIREKAKAVSWVTIHRVIGDIAVSRSIGDPDYKGFVPGEVVNECLAWPPGHDRTFSGDLLIPNPEFRTKDITRDDEFLILASDGVWDVMLPEEACQQVK
jgi:serine/threonine protein phosphatase PrpC